MLVVREEGERTIEIDGRWLYPLFLLHLAGTERGGALFTPGQEISVRDPRIGRGAVFLYRAIGIGRAEGEIVSELACSAAEVTGVDLTLVTSVPSLACATEDLLRETTDGDEGIRILEERLTDEFRTDPGAFVSVTVLADTAASRIVNAFVQTRT